MNKKSASSRPYNSDEKKPYKKNTNSSTGPKPAFKKDNNRSESKRTFGEVNKSENRPFSEKRPYNKTKNNSETSVDSKSARPYPKKDFDKKPFDKERKPFDKERKPFDKERKPFDKERKPFDKERKPFDKERKPFDKERKPFDKERKPFDKERKPFDKERKPFDKERKPISKEKREKDRDKQLFGEEKKPKRRRNEDEDSIIFEDKVVKELTDEVKVRRRFKGDAEIPSWERESKAKNIDDPMTLNKYISHSGECSRRDAAELVKQGKVRVNGVLILEPGHRVNPGDSVTLGGKVLTPQKGFVYILLNKPKDYITTTDDPQERKTVIDLVQNAEVDRLFPVGRLDRKTTGLLLLTNDGALAHKLSHPSYNIKKVYQVTLNKNLTTGDYQKIAKGLELEDGLVEVDAIAFLEHRNEIGIEIHSGKNRIVRRIFESLGYEVEKLDRVMYAGLTKKNLPRGKWRFLNEKELIFLKHFK